MAFTIYKRGQGHYTRLFSALTVFGGVAIGCYLLYHRLVANLWVQIFVPSGIAAAAAALVAWLSNRPSVADFLISAEGEIKKVSWSSRKEIVASTTIVIVVVIVFSLLLSAADALFGWLFVNVVNIHNFTS